MAKPTLADLNRDPYSFGWNGAAQRLRDGTFGDVSGVAPREFIEMSRRLNRMNEGNAYITGWNDCLSDWAKTGRIPEERGWKRKRTKPFPGS